MERARSSPSTVMMSENVERAENGTDGDHEALLH
jgi:hypothetical protein